MVPLPLSPPSPSRLKPSLMKNVLPSSVLGHTASNLVPASLAFSLADSTRALPTCDRLADGRTTTSESAPVAQRKEAHPTT